MGEANRYKGMWLPTDCEDKVSFICEKPGLKEKPTTPRTPGKRNQGTFTGVTPITVEC